jgi:23S rRNA (guanine745-N1)-methyltransferase
MTPPPHDHASCRAAQNFACPIDGTALETGLVTAPGQPWRCVNGHSFDIARDGYCNLLVVQHKASRDPGDTAEMVAARRRVLDSGIYAALADHVAASVSALAGNPRSPAPFRIVDAGCGEGYYLARLVEMAAATGRSAPPPNAACRSPGPLPTTGICRLSRARSI